MYKEKQSIKLSENAGIKQTRNHFEENEFLVFFWLVRVLELNKQGITIVYSRSTRHTKARKWECIKKNKTKTTKRGCDLQNLRF